MGEITHPRRCAAFGLVVVAAATMAAGCGGSSTSAATVSPERWQTSVCSAIGQYQHAIMRDAHRLNGLTLEFEYGVPKSSDVRRKETAATAALRDDTGTLRRQIEAAGVPRIDHGAELSAEFVAALRELEERFDALHSEALDIPTGQGRAPADALLVPKMLVAMDRVSRRMRAAHERYPEANLIACS
jgi:hypothetical protein